MKRRFAGRTFKILTLVLMTLFSFACGKASSPSSAGSLTTTDVSDPNKTTGAVNSQGLPYAGYNPTQEISVLKSQVEDTEQNRAFAQEIINVVPPKAVPVQTTATTAVAGPQPLDLKVQMKGLDNPLDFQGTFTQSGSAYRSNMVETSGQRPDLMMTAKCTDADCNHGDFLLVDPQGRKAGIVVTNDNRSIKLKTAADPLTNQQEQVPDELKQAQKINISSVQVINGVSNFEIRNLDQNGKPADLEASGELLLPNGECPQLKLTDKAPAALRNLCLRGYSGDGDFLLRGELKNAGASDKDSSGAQLQVPPAPEVPAQNAATPPKQQPPLQQSPLQAPGQTPTQTIVNQPPPTKTANENPANNMPLTPEVTTASYVYFEIARDDAPSEASQPTAAKPNKTQCPVVAKTENYLIKDIMSDCNHPEVLEVIAKKWSNGQPGHPGLVRLIKSANGCKDDIQSCDSANFNKMAQTFGKSAIPLIVGASVALQESSFLPTRSNANSTAFGWFQFIKGTAESLSPPLSHADLADIAKASNGFIQYFNEQLQKWHGDFKMALTSYNLGPGDSKTVDTYWKNAGDSKIVESYWKSDPNIPDYLKEDYSIYKDFWQIRHYCMLKGVAVNLDYAPEVLGAIFAATAPQSYDVDVTQSMEMK